MIVIVYVESVSSFHGIRIRIYLRFLFKAVFVFQSAFHTLLVLARYAKKEFIFVFT